MRVLTSLELLPPQILSPRAPAQLSPSLRPRLQHRARSATCGEKLLISSDFCFPLCFKTDGFLPAAQLLSSRISEYFFQFLSYTVRKTRREL